VLTLDEPTRDLAHAGDDGVLVTSGESWRMHDLIDAARLWLDDVAGAPSAQAPDGWYRTFGDPRD
jgi:hypothetical protein